jgi:hypothetical protein
MNSRRRSMSSAVAMLLVALVPATASADEDDPQRMAPPSAGAPAPTEEPEQRNSTGKMVTGIILTSCGLVNGLTGVGFGIASAMCNGELCGFHVIGAVGFGAVGATLLGVGIPLWVVGAGEPDHDRDEESAMVPAVVVGPGTVRAGWSF